MAFCPTCGAAVNEKAAICVKCGVSLNGSSNVQTGNVSDKEWLPALLLCLFLGTLGGHRFYTGHTGIAIVQLFTLGGCGIWTLIDLIMIITGSFKDAKGLPLKK